MICLNIYILYIYIYHKTISTPRGGRGSFLTCLHPSCSVRWHMRGYHRLGGPGDAGAHMYILIYVYIYIYAYIYICIYLHVFPCHTVQIHTLRQHFRLKFLKMLDVFCSSGCPKANRLKVTVVVELRRSSLLRWHRR